jgi:C2H2 type zinc-finger (2 copies)
MEGQNAETELEVGIPAPIEEITFYNNALFSCPLDNCLFMSNSIPATIDHLKSHKVTIVNPNQVLSYMDEYIYEMSQQMDEHVWDNQELRTKLHLKKLNEILQIQQSERDDNSPHQCLFCKNVQLPSSLMFTHLLETHGLYLGDPNNLVNVSTFLSTLHNKLARSVCILCERQFNCPAVLRKHMRKRKHFKLNPKNPFFDRFYVSSYTDGKGKGEEDDEGNVDFDEWDDVPKEETMCLFCEDVSDTPELTHSHMIETHSFDLSTWQPPLYFSLKLEQK